MRPTQTVEGNERRGALLSSKGRYLQVAVGFSSISNSLFLKKNGVIEYLPISTLHNDRYDILQVWVTTWEFRVLVGQKNLIIFVLI
jgi:hypothetical protein